MKQKELQKAIVDKVNKIFDGMDCQQDFNIYIEANKTEVPTIRYKVTEFIIPKEEICKNPDEMSCPSCGNSVWGYENGKRVCAVCGAKV